jgi:putative selenium metabolism hydrolase
MMILPDSSKTGLIRFLRDLIAIPSMGGKEGAIISRIREEMEKIGYDEVWCDGLGNLFGRLGSGKRLFAIDGHCDTVDVGNPDTWEVDPFKGDYRNGVIYGRGAADQKGGLAAAVYAGKILKEVGLPPDVSLLVVASVLEEDFEGLCWQYIIEQDHIRPEAVLLTEPSNLGIRIGQRGRMEMKVNVRGVSCHGSAPERGENAVYKVVSIVQDVERLNKRLTGDSILGKGSVAVTDIRSSAPSLCAVPDSATLHLDRRLTAGESLESAVEEIQNLPSVQDAGAEVVVPEYEAVGSTGLKVPIKAYYPIWLMEEDHPLVQAAVRTFETQFERPADVGVWTFSTNGVATKGLFDIPTIGFGPGEERYAHTAQDQIRAEDLVSATMFYATFVCEWGKEET